MDQLHKRFTADQVKVLLQGYRQGTMSRAEVEEMTRGHLGDEHWQNPFLRFAQRVSAESGDVLYHLRTRYARPAILPRGSRDRDGVVARESTVDDPQLPISDYNYAALRDRLKKKGVTVSATTITERAKHLGCYKPHPKGKAHDRQVVTAAIGALVQHDASIHLWSPFASEKWTLITSIDDYSRKLLFADFFLQETAWAHIQAAQTLMQTYGLPLQYCSTMWTTCACFASSRAGTATGASMSWKRMTWIHSGDR